MHRAYRLCETACYLCGMGNRFKIPFELGTWAGLLAFGYFLLISVTPYSPFGLARFGGFWIPVLFVFLATYRQMKTNGPAGLTFSGAFFTGLFTALSLGAIKAVLVYMYIKFYDPGIIYQTRDETIRMLEWSKARVPNPDEIAAQIETTRQGYEKMTALGMASGEVNLYLIGALPVSLLAALIFNRKPKNA